MTKLLTSAQMRALENGEINAGRVTGLELMERAGQAVVSAVLQHWPDLSETPVQEEGGAAPVSAMPTLPRSISGKMKRAIVLCGPGNNGGDGYVIARLLHQRGWDVDVRALGDVSKLPGDARANYDRWCELGAVSTDVIGGLVSPCDVLIDALFGTGLTRPVALPLSKAQADRVVAVDIPSGLCSDSGTVIGAEVLQADLTVSFQTAKLGHVLAQGAACCGTLNVADIGLPDAPGGCAVQVDRPAWAQLNKGQGHKFQHGHALVLSGGAGATGAARLAARAALRVGAGLVTLGVPADAQAEVAAQITAMMMRCVDTPAQLGHLLGDDRINAFCIGPGLGVSLLKGDMIHALLDSRRSIVLDADALTLVAQEDRLFAALHARCVLTPHEGEFARLFPDLAARMRDAPVAGPAFSKVDAVRQAANRAGCVLLLKGPDTVIAAPDGTAAVHSAQYDRDAPWLATAGSGDVLSGLITGLMARGVDPFVAACQGAWLHAEAAIQFGPGLIAEDLPEMIPAVFRSLKNF